MNHETYKRNSRRIDHEQLRPIKLVIRPHGNWTAKRPHCRVQSVSVLVHSNTVSKILQKKYKQSEHFSGVKNDMKETTTNLDWDVTSILGTVIGSFVLCRLYNLPWISQKSSYSLCHKNVNKQFENKKNYQSNTMPMWVSTLKILRLAPASYNFEVTSFSTANTTPSFPLRATAVLNKPTNKSINNNRNETTITPWSPTKHDHSKAINYQ